MRKLLLLLVLIGTGYSLSSCKKSATVTVPVLSTLPVTNISLTTATCGGNITSDGNAAVTARGVCWSTSSNPSTSDSKTADGNGTGQFTSNLTALIPGTPYYVRAYANNSSGKAYGDQVSFTTTASQLAALSTTTVSSITSTTAMSGGTITDDGGSPITARGVCWSTNTGPTMAGSHSSDGTGTGNFVSSITGLTASTPYYVRSYAVNGTGTAYGNEVSFTTSAAQSGNAVTIQGMAFSPLTLTVAVNTTVTWTNNDGVTHTVTSDAAVFNSGNVAPGGTFSYQFTTAGTYPYHCTIHNYMTGTVIVQ
jgi:plastocyanin